MTSQPALHVFRSGEFAPLEDIRKGAPFEAEFTVYDEAGAIVLQHAMHPDDVFEKVQDREWKDGSKWHMEVLAAGTRQRTLQPA